MKNTVNQSATSLTENAETEKNSREWGLRIALVGFAILWLSLMAVSWAQAADAPPANSVNNSDDDYNFSWLDPDKKIYVLQNRKFTKSGKVLLSIMGGPGLSNSYRNTWNFDPRISFFFSESWGIEGFYTSTFNTPNNTYQALVGSSQLQNILPVVREIQNEAGFNLVWVPWYAKINVFNKILYFDWYFTGGLGNINSQVSTASGPSNNTSTPTYTAQSNIAGFFGTGQNFNLTQNFLIRLDLSCALYNAPIYGTSGANSWYTNFNFSAGFGLKL
jgi:outer membrane beta-barrel protein